MNIIGKVRGSEAYVIEDGELKYPVFTESLHAKRLFDQLIASGYKLCALPFDFKKDGVSILSLPEIDYTITDDAEQDMFDMNDMDRYSADELRQRVSVEDVNYIEELPGNYSITTREQFISYLRDCQVSIGDEDFLPINYFVHPQARFTVEEWLSGEYKEYFNIMEVRRSMSYNKFCKLRDWLTAIGMEENGDATDILETYCMWGIDGINARFISKNRKTKLVYDDFIMQSGLGADAYEITRVEHALVDRYGGVFPPEDVPAGYDGWKVAYSRGTQSSAFRSKISQLKEGEYGIVNVNTKSEEEVIVYSTLKDTIEVSPFILRCGKHTNRMFSIKTIDSTHAVVAPYWWSAKYHQRVLDVCQLRALAVELINRRKFVGDVSSFKLLTDIGCDVKGALSYIVGATANSNKSEENAEEALPTDADIDLFVSGDEDEGSTPQLDMLRDIVNGEVNTGAIAEGALMDARQSAEEVFKYMYCAHFCKTRIPIQQISDLVRGDIDNNVVENTDTYGYKNAVLPLKTNDGFVVNVPCNEIRGKIDGYRSDMNSIKVKQAEQCCGFLKVTQIASEYGTDQPRHVAFEAKTVNLYADGSKASKYLNELMEIFETQLQENVPLSQQATLRLYKRATCMAEYFRVADTGMMQFTKQMGGQQVAVPFETALGIATTIKTKITSTAVYCAKMVDEDGLLTHYCVNADITPWKIYPRASVAIPCASLPALWYDWASLGMPNIMQTLTQEGYAYMGFVPWTRRYMQERYFANLEGLPKIADLVRYVKYCDDYRNATKNTEEFEHAPHIESLFYGMYPDETVRVDAGAALRQPGELPPVKISTGCIVTKDPNHGKVELKHAAQERVKRFTGFSAEDFDMLGDPTKVKLPTLTDKYITYDGESISTDDSDNLPVYVISQLVGMGYPVINLYQRKYIFRDMLGVLWEVIV